MAILEHVEKFVGPFSTLVAAAVAATVTAKFAKRQAETSELQAKIALDKLKLDAINDRIDVLEATRELIKYVVSLRHDADIDNAKIQDLRQRTLKGRYFFSKEIYEEIRKTVDRCFDVPNWVPRQPGEPLTDVDRQMIREQGEAKREVIRQRERLPMLLEKDISLDLFAKHGGTPKDAEGMTHMAGVRLNYVLMGMVGFILLLAALAVAHG